MLHKYLTDKKTGDIFYVVRQSETHVYTSYYFYNKYISSCSFSLEEVNKRFIVTDNFEIRGIDKFNLKCVGRIFKSVLDNKEYLIVSTSLIPCSIKAKVILISDIISKEELFISAIEFNDHFYNRENGFNYES